MYINKHDARKTIYPFIIFRICNTLFTLSSQYICDAEDLPDNISCITHASPAFGICNSYERAITTIHLKTFLELEPAGLHRTDGTPAADGKMMILLQGMPIRALILDEIIALQKSCYFTPLPRMPFAGRHILNFYTYSESNDIIMKLDLSSILSLVPDISAQ